MKKTRSLLTAFLLCHAAFAQQIIPLYETGKVPNALPTDVQEVVYTFESNGRYLHFVERVTAPELTAYFPEKAKNTGMAVIICPGGGYTGLAIDHEGHDMAKKLAENGIAGFVLKYRLPNGLLVKNKEIVPLQDAQRAIQIVRENAVKWRIRPNQVGILGCSAGGHLASTLGTHYRKSLIDNPKHTNLRPDFMILNYPVISFADSLTHAGSRFNLIGEMAPEELSEILRDNQQGEQRLKSLPVLPDKVREYSNELHVDAETPATFITHSVDDDAVSVQNTLLFIAALQKYKVPVESFFYAKGGHGYGMDNPTSEVDWIDSCLAWLLEKNAKGNGNRNRMGNGASAVNNH